MPEEPAEPDPHAEHLLGWAAGSSPIPLDQDGPEQRAEGLLGALLLDSDAARRYLTVQHLQDGRLRRVQAITLHQLEYERGSVAAAAAAVGITRQSAHELMDKADTDTPEAPGRSQTPPGRYGRLLAVAWAIATTLEEVAPEKRSMEQWSQLEEKAPQTLGLLPRLAEEVNQWLKTLRHRNRAAAANRLGDEFSAAMAEIGDWAQQRRATPRLSIDEQLSAYVGLASGRRVRRR